MLAKAWFLLPITVVAMRLAGFRRVRTVVQRAQERRPGRVAHDEARALARLVRVASARSPFGGNCLTRSLVLYRLLRQHGLEAGLRIGVHRPSGRFEAHAWVEHAGEALNEHDVKDRFAAFEGQVMSGGGGMP